MSCEFHAGSGAAATSFAPVSVLAVRRSSAFASTRSSEFPACCCRL